MKIKRLFDFSFAILIFIILLPIMTITAVFIYIRIGSPIFFKQERPGYMGRSFILYKFRTMTDEVDENGNLLHDENRLTLLGEGLRKLSLDELPQLINVIKGELSFVGPRPLLMEYLGRYNERQARRHEVKPGITGWAQVNGRNAISWEEKFELDIWYVENWSFWLDMKILWLTILKVLKVEGISGEGTVTMTEFMGNRDGDNNG